CTDDEKLYSKLKYMRNYGFQFDYNSKYIGCNGKFSEMNAIVGYHSMAILDDVLERKKKNVNVLKENLKRKYKFQEITNGVDSSYKDFILLDVDYEKVSKALTERDIQHKRYFLPLHLQDFVKNITVEANKYPLPNSEKVYNNSVCIPAHAKLTDDEIKIICYALNNI
ncbi:MAG: DegT/DnrJ/EryC1/StrS family aminotransferase, partial [Nanoarchaeota archaeon]